MGLQDMNTGTLGSRLSITRLAPWIILAAGILAYANSFANPFVFDDNATVPQIGRALDWRFFWNARFIVDLSFKVNYWFGQLNLAYYHATNTAIHILAGLALFGIVNRTVRLPAFSGKYDKVAGWLALTSSCIWLLHPLQTQSVTYICQRYESMMGLFLFTSLYCFIRSADSRTPGLWRGLCVLACFIGMATKEVIVVLPIVIMLYDYVFLHESLRKKISERWVFYVGLAGSWGWLAMLTSMMKYAKPAGVYVWHGITPFQHLLTQCQVILHYIKLSFFPTDLCLDYYWLPVGSLVDVRPQALVLTCMMGIAFWMAARRRATGFLGIFFFLVLAPTSSVIPRPDFAFEHRMYVPLAALAVFVVFGGYSLLSGRVRPHLLLLTAAFLVAVLAFLTHQRNEDYRSEQAMWRDVISKRPDNYRAYLGAISALLNGDRPVEAERLARSLVDRMNKVMAEASPVRNELLAHNAACWYQGAQNQLGRTLLAQGKIPEAIMQFQEATREQPDNAIARYNLAWALYLSGRKDEAEQAVRKVLSLRPDYGRARMLMGLMLAERGMFRDALKQYEQIVSADPDAWAARCETAWFLAACPDDSLRDGKRAIEMAEEVCQVTDYRSIRALDALGAAYAEAGRFPDAVVAANRALKLVQQSRTTPGQGNNQIISDDTESLKQISQKSADIESRIRLYESRLPFRENASGSGQYQQD
jgi:protein O-mannosyl-transferase